MTSVEQLLAEIHACTVCQSELPLGANPIVQLSAPSKIALVSQAPGAIAHGKSLPFQDASGRTLRSWLGVDEETFYKPDNFAIVPIGFCYPGKGKSGDLPPRSACALLWHKRVWEQLTNVQLTILIGQYAQQYYLPNARRQTLTETVQNYQSYLPTYFPLVHPSPRNGIWQRKNLWFEAEVVPQLQELVRRILA